MKSTPLLELDDGTRLTEGPAIVEDFANLVLEKISRLTYAGKMLAGKDCVMVNHFTVADAYLFTVNNWTIPTKIDISGLANLVAFRARVAARPAVQAAMKTEGLI